MNYIRSVLSLVLMVFLFSARLYSQENKMHLNLMTWPAHIELTGGTFKLTQNFTVEVTGNPATRLSGAARNRK